MLEGTETKFRPEPPPPLRQTWNAPEPSASPADFPAGDCESESKRRSLTYPVLEIDEDGLAKIVHKEMPPDPLVTKLRMKSQARPQVMTLPPEPKVNSSQLKEQRIRKDEASRTPAKSSAAARGSVQDHQSPERCPMPSPWNQLLHPALLDPFPPTADNQFFILRFFEVRPRGSRHLHNHPSPPQQSLSPSANRRASLLPHTFRDYLQSIRKQALTCGLPVWRLSQTERHKDGGDSAEEICSLWEEKVRFER